MKEDNKNHELQSRREFFKNAAKSALPILGAMFMIKPIVSSAKTSNACNYSCTAWCADNCSGQCKGSCTNACARSCSSYCNAACNIKCYKSAY